MGPTQSDMAGARPSPGPPAAEEIKIASLNVNGMRIPAKRRSLIEKFRKGNFDFCLVQETHCTRQEAKIWQSEWGGSAYFCHGGSSSRGVIILVKRGLDFSVERQVNDEEGRMLLLEVTTRGSTYLIGSLYAPTADAPDEQSQFMDTLEENLTSFCSVNVILGGDLNVALCPTKDSNSSTSSSSYGEGMRRRIYAMMEDADLTDAWRYKNPSSRQYTFHRGTQASRIDYWLISNHLADTTSRSEIVPIALSDHALMSINIGLQQAKRGPGLAV